METKITASMSCAMSLKWSWVRKNVANLAIHFRIPIIQVGRHLTTTLPHPQKLSVS
jgi:hypothetical protein